ncbi:MAG: hypothetical protein ABI472_12500 [Ginsengibacter sp.]
MTDHKMMAPEWLVASMLIVMLLFVAISCDFNNHSDHSKAIFTNAVSYNEFIITRQKELMEDLDMYNLASEHDYPLALKMLDTLSVHATQNLEDITILAPFNEDSAFRETAIDEFNFYDKTFVACSRKLIGIKMRIDSGTAVDADYDNYNAWLKKMKKQSAPIESRLEEIQKRFAKKNNMQLTPSKKEEATSEK